MEEIMPADGGIGREEIDEKSVDAKKAELDEFLHNYRPGKEERLGPADLKTAHHPRSDRPQGQTFRNLGPL